MSATEDDKLPRITIARLDVADLRRSCDDPALRALMAQGWQVLASVVIDGPEGQHLHLVLRPPVPAPAPVAAPVAAPAQAPTWLGAAFVLVCACAAVQGALLVWLL